MLTDSLIGHIDNAVAQVGFTDVYKNRLNASHVRHLYEGKQRCSFSSTDAITVPRPELEALTCELEPLLGTYRSPSSGLVGNGLYALTGSWVQLNKGTKSVIEIGPHCGAIYGLRSGAESRSGAAK